MNKYEDIMKGIVTKKLIDVYANMYSITRGSIEAFADVFGCSKERAEKVIMECNENAKKVAYDMAAKVETKLKGES